MTEGQDSAPVVRPHHEQMLKLVAKSFYSELINYGVNKAEILAVAGHLLDNMVQTIGPARKEGEYYNQLFRIKDVQDDWRASQRLTVHQVSLAPLEPPLIPAIASWLADPAVRESFVHAFPVTEGELAGYFQQPARQYLGIFYDQEPAGIMGAENIDRPSSKLEMRKLVGHPEMHGKGIGKRATFLFLYYVFEILKFHKIYLHTTEINIRNLNLNSKFGFELEGVFFEDAMIHGEKHDVVRMALRAPVWRELFG